MDDNKEIKKVKKTAAKNITLGQALASSIDMHPRRRNALTRKYRGEAPRTIDEWNKLLKKDI